MNWRVKLNGTDITAYCSGVSTSYQADAICGECTVELASRAPLAGIVVPRVPQVLSIVAEEFKDGAWVSKGAYYLEAIDYPQDTDAKTASIWGRSLSARLGTPWAHKISKQWPGGESIGSIMAEVAGPCGVTISLDSDFDVCQYCYAVSDQSPAEIIRDLATRSGQILWPQLDGTLTVAPRRYRDLPAPAVVLDSDEIIVESVERATPDFGNRILVSGDGSVACLSVTVVPLADEDACVVADGQSTVRLIAIVLGSDGLPVALGTVVTWSASAGLMSAETSETQSVVRQAEAHTSDSYFRLTLDLPAESVIGVYARRDVRRSRNLYVLRGGSVSGRTVSFEAPLDFFDQAVFVDYVVKGAPITWVAGWVPGDVTVLASVAGAQGFATLHQSNPTACASQIALEASPASPCLGEPVQILLKTLMFGGAGVGAAVFGLVGCGSLSSTRKALQPRTITETLRTNDWGGAVEVKLSAVPVEGTTPIVYLAGTTTANLYASHAGQTIILTDDEILPGTQVDVTYIAGGTAVVTWTPSAIPSGFESIVETLLVTHATVESVLVAQATLTRTPTAAPTCIPAMEIANFYSSHDTKVVTLLQDSGVILPVGTQVVCSYQSVWGSQPGCSATITVRVEDGSEDGGLGQIAVTARDCREVVIGDDYDPENPDQIPDENPSDEDGLDDSSIFLPDDPEDPIDPTTACDADSINRRTPNISATNFDSVVGVGTSCPGACTCDQICSALRSKGRLADAGMMWSQCMERCADTRAAKCTDCTLSGPATLNPGEAGAWVDGKTNSGEWKGELGLVSRTFEGGYIARMPSGGGGPFTVKVCYGESEDTCCEATVAFPDCVLEGPDELEPGIEGTYVPSLGMSGASVSVGGEMVFVRNLPYDLGFVAKMQDGACNGGTVTVSYGGRVCGTLTVDSSLSDFAGYIEGPTVMDAGEMAYFSHNLGPGAVYNGTLVMGSGGVGADGATLVMPSDAAPNAVYTASWTGGICGKSASINVECLCIPDDPGDPFFLIYPVNRGPVYARAYNVTAQSDPWSLSEGQYWVGVHPTDGRDLAWIKYGDLVFGWPYYKGACE